MGGRHAATTQGFKDPTAQCRADLKFFCTRHPQIHAAFRLPARVRQCCGFRAYRAHDITWSRPQIDSTCRSPRLQGRRRRADWRSREHSGGREVLASTATMLSHSTFRRRMRPPTTRLTICTLRGAPRKMMASRESLEAERSRAIASHDSLPACPWPPLGNPELEPRRRAWRG